jgi:TfoX/Sxy family transcriptional regulator of competence genes
MTDGRNTPHRDLLEEIAEGFSNEPDVTMGTMFRSPGLRAGGKIFAFLGHDGELIVKLPQDRTRQLVDAGTAEHVTMGTRTMREWVALPAQESDTATLTLWRNVAHDAHQYVDSLRRSS